MPRYLLRSHIVVGGGGEEAMAVKELLSRVEGNYSTLRIKLTLSLTPTMIGTARRPHHLRDGSAIRNEDRIH